MTTSALFALAHAHGHMILPPPSDGKIDSISIVLPTGTCAIILNADGISEKDYRDHAGHEVGHCEKGAFYTRLSAPTTREKCEETANRWQYENMVPFCDLDAALKSGYKTPWELSDIFNLPERTVLAAIDYYKMKGLLTNDNQGSPCNPDREGQGEAKTND